MRVAVSDHVAAVLLVLAATLAAAGITPTMAYDEASDYATECKSGSIRPGYENHCAAMKRNLEEKRERQARTGLIEGDFYLTSKPTVTCVAGGSCFNIPAGEPIRLLKADRGDGQAVVVVKAFPYSGTNMRLDEIGPHAVCRQVTSRSTEPYMPTERSDWECTPDAVK